jgi:putative glutamine transport system substrate-binding protein
MKKTTFKVVAAAIVLSMVGAAGFAFGSKDANPVEQIKKNKILKVGVKEDVPNFGYLNPATNKHEGLEIEIAQAVAKKILGDSSKVRFTGVTAATRGPLLDTGELDIVLATFTVTEERRKSFDFSDLYFTDAIALMVKKAGGYASFKDLNGKTIGVAQTATTKAALEAAASAQGITLKFNEYATYPDLKTALDSGRIDCFSVDKAILMGYMEPSVVILPDLFNPQPYGAAMKKGNTELLAVVNQVLAEMQASGEMYKLLAKYNLK